MIDSTVTDSFTKGCFFFRGEKSSKQKCKTIRVKTAGECIEPYGANLFRDRWSEMEADIKIMQADLYRKVFVDLLAFVDTAKTEYSSNACATEDEYQRSTQWEIPTAALIMGVNMPDHSTTIESLVTLIKENVTASVCVLKSKTCLSIKAVISQVILTIMSSISTDEELENINVKESCTMATLSFWYREKFIEQSKIKSKRKRKRKPGEDLATSSSQEGVAPIVIVLEDLEAFQPNILQDLVSICSFHAPKLPIVFVFGVATAVTAVHRILPMSVSSHLCIETFQAQPPSDYLTCILNQVLLTDKFPFKLGTKVFNLLIDNFLCHDFSVKTFIQGLKFCMMEHFTTSPVSSLCDCLDTSIKTLRSFKNEDVEQFRRLPSFRSYVEDQPAEMQSALLLDDHYTKEVISTLVTDMHTYHKTLFPMLRCLHSVNIGLPGQPVGRQLREAYGKVLANDVCTTEEYKAIFSFLGMMGCQDLKQLLQDCCTILDNTTIFEAVVSKIKSLIVELDNVAFKETKPSGASPAGDVVRSPPQVQSKIPTPYERLRAEALAYLDSQFRKFLSCPKNLPLHEIFYFDSSAAVKRHLLGSPRVSIQTALSLPHYYLQCSCCDANKEDILSTMPDVCIVYKLHLESGRLINLFDWLQSFVAIVLPESTNKSSNEVDEMLHARFIQAVSELQFLGFIKPTKRKTDHVARLTWGGC